MAHTLSRTLSGAHQFITNRHKRLLPGVILVLLIILPAYVGNLP